jgi:hypothetical protein
VEEEHRKAQNGGVHGESQEGHEECDEKRVSGYCKRDRVHASEEGSACKGGRRCMKAKEHASVTQATRVVYAEHGEHCLQVGVVHASRGFFMQGKKHGCASEHGWDMQERRVVERVACK